MSTDKHASCIRGFHHLAAAWYGPGLLQNTRGDTVLDEIMVGMYHPQGGTTGEFAIRWQQLARKAVPRLEVFDDAWSALALMQDLQAKLAELDNANPPPEQIVNLLLSLGFTDLTQKVRK